ncbi:MAG: DNA-binding protein [Thermoplasmata archaeon]
MEYKVQNGMLVGKLEHEEDLFDQLKKIYEEVDSKGILILSGIGMLDNFELGYYQFEKGSYEFKKYDNPMELVSMKGSITSDGSIHIHAALAGDDHVLRGGHLKGGNVFNVLELGMFVYKDVEMAREYDEKVDADLLSVK